MSKGGSTSTGSTWDNLPSWIEEPTQRLIERSETESQRDYTPYPNARVAGQSPDTLSAYTAIRNLSQSGAPGYDQANQNYGNINTSGGSFMNYQTGNIYGQNPGDFQVGNISWDASSSRDWDNPWIQKYMNPYTQQMTNRQKNEAVRDWQRYRPQVDDSAIQAGAFGGSRHGIADYLAQEELQRDLQDIQARNDMQNWQQAQNIFTSDADRALQAGRYGLEAQQLQEAARQFGGEFQQRAQQAYEDLRNRGAQLGLEGLGRQLAATEGLSDVQGLYDQMIMSRSQALATTGDEQQAYEQMLLDLAYSDFRNQLDQERTNLQFLNSIISGVPVSGLGITTEYAPYDYLSSLMGLGITGAGIYKTIKESNT